MNKDINPQKNSNKTMAAPASNGVKIYFAASIRGGREDAAIYTQIVEYLKNFGEVLTEFVADKHLSTYGQDGLTDGYIHDRDLKLLLESDVIVAEVSTPSLGVGYEIARGIENNKRVLCLYRPQPDKKLSAMIAGCSDLKVIEYETLEDSFKLINNFFKAL
jgi:2'-deoxynucleoside 5'-phosphate N-hydrolase